MKQAHIALLTDFGTADPYVAALKGVLLSAVPGIRITDISHDVPRHNVSSAAYILRAAAPWFPRGTIFVCVVDPGVGTKRRILCLKLSGCTFLAPDNGLLERFADRNGVGRWYALKPPASGQRVSATFHGRDIMAPAAARLAGGDRLASLARPVHAPRTIRFLSRAPRQGGGKVEGSVLHVDRFGNIITSIVMPGRPTSSFRVKIGRKTVRTLCSTYDEAPAATPFIITGSSGLLEVSINRGDAARALRIRPGHTVRAYS